MYHAPHTSIPINQVNLTSPHAHTTTAKTTYATWWKSGENSWKATEGWMPLNCGFCFRPPQLSWITWCALRMMWQPSQYLFLGGGVLWWKVARVS